MYCPRCLKKSKTKVIDSRLQSNQVIRRRRQCKSCRHRFTTWESRMNLYSREDLLKKSQKELNKIKKQAQKIVDGINKNE